MSSASLGLIAGNGRFPLLFAKEAKRKNFKVVAVGIRGDTSFWLRFFVDQLSWVNPGELRKMVEFFKGQGINQILMAGQVNPNNLFDQSVTLDKEFQKLFLDLKDRKADTIFKAVADKLKKEGLELVDSTFLLKDYLAPRGTLTRRGPTEKELADIAFGRDIAKALGGLDVGQTVVIKEKAVVAIEAMEGTDKTILRGGGIAKVGAVVVKTAKPKQDERFDIPVIGPRTIQTMIKAKCTCLAVEAGRTLIIDKTLCQKLADENRICILAS